MSIPEDPEKKRVRGMRYRAEKKADPEWMARERERWRLYRERKRNDPEFRAHHRDRGRQYREENREAVTRRRRAIESDPEFRKRRNAAGPALKLRQAHGPTAIEALAAMWERQEGRCYLCGDPMDRKKAVADHDHSCCPPGKSCPLCRRGLACNRCNLLIGMVDDDAMLLRRIAGNLGVAIDLYRDRMAGKPVQLDILDAAS